MNNTANILNLHGVENRERNGRLEAADVYIDASHNTVTEWVDVTDWDRAKLSAWLGY